MSTFTHHCTVCDRRQLIFPSMLAGVSGTGRGVEVAFTCWCGAAQSAVLVSAPETAGAPA